jgi:hypothetical protein
LINWEPISTNFITTTSTNVANTTHNGRPLNFYRAFTGR